MEHFLQGELVVVSITQSRTKNIEQIAQEGQEPVLVEHKLVETSEHTARVIKRKYVKTVETSNGEDIVLFDGFCYQCDDGVVYYPDWENQGKVVRLKIASDTDIQFLGD